MPEPIYWLDEHSHDFPPACTALKEPNGLLAAGGDLNPDRIICAYAQGIFPWYSPGEPILWWSPDPRSIVLPQKFKASRSLAKIIKKKTFHVTTDTCFERVMRQCAEPRIEQEGTWIDEGIIGAYCKLHDMGVAHSIECWNDDQLVGGLYGLALGRVFFGESMFSLQSNASKVAFAALCQQLTSWDFELIDCQVHSQHLESMGAIEVTREEFMKKLTKGLNSQPVKKWAFDAI